MKTIWEWLDLAPTSDVAAIKSAYASQAKKWHPEDHPEEFKQLQQAYKQAMQQAKRQKSRKGSENAAKSFQDAQEPIMPKEHGNNRYMPETISATEKNKTSIPAEIEDNTQNIEDKNSPKAAENKQNTEDKNSPKTAENKQNTENKNSPKAAENIQPIINQKEAENREDTESRKDSKETGNQTENRDKTENTKETVYNYNEIEQQECLEEFWNEFYMLARSPYLANNLIMWEYLLHRNCYRSLMQEASFHQSLILNVNAVYGLRRKTICYIDACMRDFRKEAMSQGKEWVYRPRRPTPDSRLWRYKKLRFWKISTIAATKEWKEAHEFLLAQVKKSGMDTRLQDIQSVKCYIGLYRDFAKVNGRQIEKWYNQGRQMQLFVKTIIVMAVIMIGFIIYVNKDLKQRKQEEQVQVTPQMVEELRKYNENPEANPTPYVLK